MKFLFTGCLFLLIVFHAPAQTTGDFSLVHTIKGTFTDFTVDDLLNVYSLSPTNTLTKYGPNGDELFRYSNNEMGRPATIDVANPMNLLLFYPDYQTAITLNRTLTESGQFDLFGPDLLEITAACLSIENKLWVFDASNFLLKLIDERGQAIEISDDLSLYFDKTPVITQMEAHKGYIYANVPESGIIIFDNFAQFDKEMPIPGIKHFQYSKNNLIFQRDSSLFQLDLNSLKEKPIQLPRTITKGAIAKVKHQFVYICDKDKGIEVWEFRGKKEVRE
ncbi:MAG: hypothetical protein DWQ02_13410 [Bacteroidetes bacterium]|nr:MAG: hypothetical protein DWQ02_13410 [Bacteroidota bacterium]